MPKPRRFVRFALAAALLLTLATGCGSSGSTAPGGPPTGTVAELLALIDRAIVPGAVLPQHVDTTAAYVATMDVEGFEAAFALFPTTLSPQVVQFSDAGAVSVRTGPPLAETAFDKQQLVVNGFTMNVYSTLPSHPAGLALVFDGAVQHRFTVGGSSAVAAFSDSVLSVSRPPITAPAAAATVTRASGLAISWTPMGSDSTVYITAAVTSMVDSSLSVFATIARDLDGTTSVGGGVLSNLPPGAARLSLARSRIVRRSAGARLVNLICEAVSTRTIELQ